jgi:hypothetical protein
MWKKSAARSPSAWVRRKVRPVRIDTAWGRSDPGGGEDASDGAGADPVTEAEADQLTLDSAVPPGRILRRQMQDKLADLTAERWAASLVGVAPVPLEQPAVPGQQRRRGDDPMR